MSNESTMCGDSPTRLNKYISESGICSRREADRYIEQGHVFINGKRAKIGDRVYPGDAVRVNGLEIEPKKSEDLVFLAFNKPVGVTSTTEAGTKGNIIDYVNHSERIFPIGRLDKDSQGLIFLTNNGDIVNKILRAGNEHEKEYVVTINKPVTEQFIEAMSNGIPMMGGMTKKCLVTKEAALVFRITLIQGMNRQIRRMCEHLGYEVMKLERVRIMNVSLKGIPLGEWRELTEPELAGIFKLIENSVATEEGSFTKKNQQPTKNNDENFRKRTKDSGKSTTSSYTKSKPFSKTNQRGKGKKSSEQKKTNRHSKPQSGRRGAGKSRGR